MFLSVLYTALGLPTEEEDKSVEIIHVGASHKIKPLESEEYLERDKRLGIFLIEYIWLQKELSIFNQRRAKLRTSLL